MTAAKVRDAPRKVRGVLGRSEGNVRGLLGGYNRNACAHAGARAHACAQARMCARTCPPNMHVRTPRIYAYTQTNHAIRPPNIALTFPSLALTSAAP